MKNYVIIGGKDCDGYFTPKIYKFETEEEAFDFAQSSNEWSDGLIYDNVDYQRAFEYSKEYEINF